MSFKYTPPVQSVLVPQKKFCQKKCSCYSHYKLNLVSESRLVLSRSCPLPEIKNPFRSRGQKPKSYSNSKGEPKKQSLGLWVNVTATEPPTVSQSKGSLSKAKKNDKYQEQCLGMLDIVFCPCTTPACSSVRATIHVQLKREKQVHFVLAVNPVCLVNTICTDSVSPLFPLFF